MTAASRTRGRFDIQALKERADLVAEVEERSGPGRWSGRTVTFRCPSPDHQDRTPSFTVDTESRRWRCWSQCGRSGDVIELVEWLDGLSTGDAIAHLGRRYGLEPDTGHDRPRPRKAPPSRPPVRVVTPATDTGQPHPDPEKAERLLDAFLDRRGWSRETADAVGLSVVLDPWGKPRIRFPFRRGEDVLVWQDRALLDGQAPKWLTPSGATLYPFGLETLERFTEDLSTCPVCPVVEAPAVWVVEGPADAVTLRNIWPDIAALGIPGTESWKDHYAAALAGLPVVVVADNDPAGEKLREEVNAALLDAEAVPVNVKVPEDYNDLSEWYSAAGMEDFADGLLDLTDAAVEVALAGEVAS